MFSSGQMMDTSGSQVCGLSFHGVNRLLREREREKELVIKQVSDFNNTLTEWTAVCGWIMYLFQLATAIRSWV